MPPKLQKYVLRLRESRGVYACLHPDSTPGELGFFTGFLGEPGVNFAIFDAEQIERLNQVNPAYFSAFEKLEFESFEIICACADIPLTIVSRKE